MQRHKDSSKIPLTLENEAISIFNAPLSGQKWPEESADVRQSVWGGGGVNTGYLLSPLHF